MRLFMAISLDAEIKAALLNVQKELRPMGKALRLVTEDQMHLTVKFLGEVADGRLPEIAGAVQEIAGACRAFELGVGGLGCFPERGAVRVVWVGVRDDSGLLEKCYEVSERVWEKAGFAPESRDFNPHLTLGRVKDPAISGRLRGWLDGRTFEAGTQNVTQLTLYESRLSHGGATYAVAARAELQSADI